MTPDDRYDVSGLPEAQFEPGSNEQVLKNRLGIASTQEMDDTEARALAKAMDVLVRKYGETHRFCFDGTVRTRRVAAVQAGLDKNYRPMERLSSEIIERSLSAS